MSFIENVVEGLREEIKQAHYLFHDMVSIQPIELFEQEYEMLSKLVPSIAEVVAFLTRKTVDEVAVDVVDMIADLDKADSFLRDLLQES